MMYSLISLSLLLKLGYMHTESFIRTKHSLAAVVTTLNIASSITYSAAMEITCAYILEAL